MNRTLIIIRSFFVSLCLVGSFVYWNTSHDLGTEYIPAVFLIGASIAALVIAIDIVLKGFSLRGLTALTFGLTIGAVIAFLIGNSPLFEAGDEQTVFIARMALFLACMYLGTVIALRGKDDLNLIIPYIRFVPHNVDIPVVVIDTSVLIDGRIASICQSRFISSALVIPKFVIEELHRVADSEDPQRQLKGRKGIEVLNKLKNMKYIDLRIKDFEIEKADHVDSKLIYLAQSLKAKLMTTDYNLAKLAECQGVEWLNINALSKALNPEVSVGQYIDVDLVKQGKESHQGVGFLSDGSMVVVNEGAEFIGTTVIAEVISILPSAGGKMIFTRLHSRASEVLTPTMTACVDAA